jgi:predicted permease
MFRRTRALEGLDRDIQDHIARETQEGIERGLSPGEARRQALVRFGNAARVAEDTRGVWSWGWLDQLRQDIRYARRTWRRNPGFATVVVLTLALGIGANTAIFTLVDAIMLRPLPVHAPGELYFVAYGINGPAGLGGNYPYFERIRARTDLFAGVTTFIGATFKVATAEGVEIAQGQYVSGNYHAVVAVPVTLGRGFSAEADHPGADSLIAVISDGYWARKFGRDPQVLGRTLTIDRRAVTIVGVTAPGFDGLEPGRRFDITLPIAVREIDDPGFLTLHDTWLGEMPIIGRLKAGVEEAQASAAIGALARQYFSEPENSWVNEETRVAALLSAGRGVPRLRRRYADALRALMAMVAIVLLIACVNVANLHLARGTARAKEMAVRMSIGAGRRRVMVQMFTESLLLTLLGGTFGFVLARFVVGALVAIVGSGPNPILLNVHPNLTVVAFTLAICGLTALLFGLAPAVGCTRVDLTPALKASGAGMRRHARRWSTRQALVASQIALCVVLIAGAGLLARTLRNLETRDSGIDRSGLLLFSLDVSQTTFRPEQLPVLCQELIDRLVGRSQAESGACSRNVPIDTHGNARPLDVPGAPAQPLQSRYVFVNMVTPDYFRTFGIGMARGRVFEPRDAANGEPVAVINRAAARHFFGEEDPIGRRVHFFRDDGHPMTIVGIVGDATQRSLREEAPMTVYTPLAQLRAPEPSLTVALRTAQDPSVLAASIRADVRALSPVVVVDYVRTMHQQIADALQQERLLALLSSAFGVLALVLSCLGLYGMVAYDIARRTRDLGVRMALGARRIDIVQHVLRGAVSASSIGVLGGLLAAILAMRVLASLLFGVTARDPLTLTCAAAVLVFTALGAAVIPARRASRLDPVVALRTE